MQRQSLGSPAGRHPPPVHGGAEDDDDGKKRRKKKAGAAAGVPEIDEAGADSGTVTERPLRRSSSGAAAGAERSIHLIPVVTLLCFLVLYLCSHDPSTTDIAGLGGVGRLLDHTDHTAVAAAGIGRYAAGVGGGSVSAAVLSHRSLKELERFRGNHGSRKLGWRRSAA